MKGINDVTHTLPEIRNLFYNATSHQSLIDAITNAVLECRKSLNIQRVSLNHELVQQSLLEYLHNNDISDIPSPMKFDKCKIGGAVVSIKLLKHISDYYDKNHKNQHRFCIPHTSDTNLDSRGIKRDSKGKRKSNIEFYVLELNFV